MKQEGIKTGDTLLACHSPVRPGGHNEELGDSCSDRLSLRKGDRPGCEGEQLDTESDFHSLGACTLVLTEHMEKVCVAVKKGFSRWNRGKREYTLAGHLL